jgi:uncharacterized Zn-finger protein
VSQRKERRKEGKKERNPSICNALSHRRHYQNQAPMNVGFTPNMHPNYSDGNAHGPTTLLLLLPLLGLYSTTLGTQKPSAANKGSLTSVVALLSLSLFSKEKKRRVYGSGYSDP